MLCRMVDTRAPDSEEPVGGGLPRTEDLDK